jgi:GDPmannose 4,6-dehydratase
MENIALITGITGQDGSYLSEELLQSGWVVYGIMRRASVFTTERIEGVWDHDNLHVRHGDMTDIAGLSGVLAEISRKHPNPNKFYVFNLAAQSHVGVSFETPLYTAQVDAFGVLNLLEAIRNSPLSNIAKICQASTSEMYGKVIETPQTETTPFYPRSPYGVAKLYAYWICKNYREAYGMAISNSICFNHESERRGRTFVTRKITLAVSKMVRHIKQVAQKWQHVTYDSHATHALVHAEMNNGIEPVVLGNLDAKRDWGHALDYIRGMIKILDHPIADDYVLATGETHSVREFLEVAWRCLGFELVWLDTETNPPNAGFIRVPIQDETGRQIDTIGCCVVHTDARYLRPAEVDMLLGDASKAEKVLGWKPTIKFEELVEQMVFTDLGMTREEYWEDKITLFP